MSMTQKLTVALTLEVEAQLSTEDMTLLRDHLAQQVEGAFHTMQREGRVTPDDEAFEQTTVELASVLCADPTKAVEMVFPMKDWRIDEQCQEDMEPGDDIEYLFDAAIGNQTYIDIRCPADPSRYLGVGIEINNGRPKLFITDIEDGDVVLHVAQTEDGLVLVPDRSDVFMQGAPATRYSYDGVPNARLIERDHALFQELQPKTEAPETSPLAGSSCADDSLEVAGEAVPGSPGEPVAFPELHQLACSIDESWEELERVDWSEAEQLYREVKFVVDKLPTPIAALDEILTYAEENKDWDCGYVCNWPKIIREALEESDPMYTYRYHRSEDCWEVYKVNLAGEEDWVANVVTETVAELLVTNLSP